MNHSDKFSKEMNAEFAKLTGSVANAITHTGLYGWNLVTSLTPVLTGRARASWLLNVDVAPDTTVAKVDTKERFYDDPKRPSISFDLERNQAIVISNNVEYIEDLEHGSDKRTAFAMVATATPRIENVLKRRLKKIK